MMKPRYSFIKEETMSRIEKLLKAIINNTTYDEPRLSRIEEIFYSILYSLPYNADAQSRIEALLLALKESGLYDERTLSRIEEILKCKLDGSTYTGWIGSRVEMLLNEWELSEIIEATFTSFPIIIKANGEPLIDYTIYGNTVQNGTPTPDNPIQPQETGERTGNLYVWPYTSTWSVDGSGQNRTVHNSAYIRSSVVKLKPNTQYTISAKAAGANDTYCRIAIFDEKPQIGSVSTHYYFSSGDDSTTFTTGADEEWGIVVQNNAATSSINLKRMLNEGSTALPYEPYGYKIPISSANITTPVYLGEVRTTRKIKKLVLTGEETSWTALSPYYTVSADNVRPWLGCICTHCAYNGIIGGNSNTRLWIKQASFPDYQTLGDFKSYLAAQYANGTPVTVWYVLANEETGIVNEPLMKIGEYADTLSMEQAGVEIPTLNKPNTTVIDVETELKPSKMYVKYNGEGTRVYITSDNKLYITSNNEIYVLKR
jgi:hypothetical protein